jgi:DNA ligase-1
MGDQAMLVRAFKTLRAVAATASKKEKESLLKRGDSPYLRALLVAAYNKYVTYRIQQIEQPLVFNNIQPDTMEEFVELCDLLASHTVGSTDAKLRIRRFLATNTPEGAEIFTAALLRDLRGGFDEKTCNKAFPGLIPVFNVQLANKVEDWDAIPFPAVVEEKYDGVRTIAIYDGTDVKFFSREGREFDECGVIAEQIKQLACGLPFVLDGEFIATKFNPSNKTCEKYADGNWPFNYGLSLVKSQDKTKEEVAEHLSYLVWDCIDYDYFVSNGVKGTDSKLSERKVQLLTLFERLGIAFNNLQRVGNFLCNNKAEVMQIFRELRSKGKEGAMIKNPNASYEFKRSNAVLKLKEFFNMDLRVVGAEEGNGKFTGMLGALLVQDDEGKIASKVGSGFVDDDRVELWVEYLSGRLTGQIVEVCAQEVTKDGSLRFPTFVGMRWDKTTTEGRV